MTIASIVYLLCGVTSTACFVLLLRGYLRTRTRLLLFASLSFAVFAVNNILLYYDLVVIAEGPSLAMGRACLGLAGALILLYGMLWETA